jgi:hypothetical protein
MDTELEDWEKKILELKKIALEKGETAYGIGQATGYSKSTIQRVFDLQWCPQLKIYLDIAKYLGLEIKTKKK